MVSQITTDGNNHTNWATIISESRVDIQNTDRQRSMSISLHLTEDGEDEEEGSWWPEAEIKTGTTDE